MPSTFTVFLIGAFFSVVLLLVLCSLIRSGIPGVKEWGVANAIGVVAFVLYALGKELPPIIGYEVANGAFAAATAGIFLGFRRFFRQSVPVLAVTLGIAATVAAIAYFHYWSDRFAMRTVTVSTFQTIMAAAIGISIYRARKHWTSNYAFLFTTVMAGIIAVGHAVRAVIYINHTETLTSLLQPSPWNVFFVSAGTLVLPALTLGGIMMVHDSMMAKAERAANRDFLTGAWSRRAFFDLAEREIVRARRAKTDMALLLIDIDHFKNINDSFGHAVGDQVLVDAVLKAETTIRANDYFARFGGEEFAVLLPETGRAPAAMVAERLRVTLARHTPVSNPYVKSKLQPYTVSIGLAILRENETLEELIQRADTALYAAKATGRNRVVSDSELAANA